MNNPTQHRSWILGMHGRAAGAALALAIMLVPAILATGSAQAQTFTTIDVTGAGTGLYQGTAITAMNVAGDVAGVYDVGVASL